MKGKYNGRRMTIYGAILPGTIAIARSVSELTRAAERAILAAPGNIVP